MPWEPGVGEQELAPLVDQLATDREGGLVRRMCRKRVDEDLRSSEPLQVGTTHGVEVPRPSDQVGIVGFMSSGEPLGVHALGCEQGVQLGEGRAATHAPSPIGAYPRNASPPLRRSRPARSGGRFGTTRCQRASQPSAVRVR